MPRSTDEGSRKQLLDEPDLVSDAVEELLRRFGISNIARVAERDCEFHGVEFRRKDKKNHLAFGTGPHLCVGHLLARIELRVMIEETLPRLTNLRLAPQVRLAYESGGTLALKSLPLRWDPPP